MEKRLLWLLLCLARCIKLALRSCWLCLHLVCAGSHHFSLHLRHLPRGHGLLLALLHGSLIAVLPPSVCCRGTEGPSPVRSPPSPKFPWPPQAKPPFSPKQQARALLWVPGTRTELPPGAPSSPASSAPSRPASSGGLPTPPVKGAPLPPNFLCPSCRSVSPVVPFSYLDELTSESVLTRVQFSSAKESGVPVMCAGAAPVPRVLRDEWQLLNKYLLPKSMWKLAIGGKTLSVCFFVPHVFGMAQQMRVMKDSK